MRKKRKIRWPVLVCALVGIGLGGLHVTRGAEEELTYQSAAVCGSCHSDIHGMWASGMHAQAYADPIFQASFLQAFFETKGEAARFCLRCHDPTSRLPEDFDVQRDIAGAGVVCDFCHTVQEVDLQRSGSPFVSQPGMKKTGPYLNARSPAHDTEQKPFFKKSEFCAGCHQLAGQDGVMILGTYQEWKESPYAAEGVQCQDCHMPIQPGKKIVSSTSTISKRKVNLHNLAGGHSIEQVRSAVKVEIKEATRDGDTLFVTVSVANVHSGHKIPTGTPSRRLLLRVSVKDRSGRLEMESEKAFERVLMDDKKQVLAKDHEIFLHASRVYYDNRIGPKEVREVPFSFTIPYPNLMKNWEKKLTIEAKLFYQYLPQVVTRRSMVIEIVTDRYPKE